LTRLQFSSCQPEYRCAGAPSEITESGDVKPEVALRVLYGVSVASAFGDDFGTLLSSTQTHASAGTEDRSIVYP
jgi:hypothetical protein